MASSATSLVSGMRQNTQLVLAFPVDGRSEAPEGTEEGTEPRAAGRRDESPAINEQWMERACERDNCKQVLARIRGNRGSPGVDGIDRCGTARAPAGALASLSSAPPMRSGSPGHER